MLSTALLSTGSLSHRRETNGIRGLIGFITFFLPQTAFKAIRWIIYQSNLGLCWSVGVRAHRGARSGYLGCSPNGTWVLSDECWVTWRVGWGGAHLNLVSGERKDWRDEGRQRWSRRGSRYEDEIQRCFDKMNRCQMSVWFMFTPHKFSHRAQHLWCGSAFLVHDSSELAPQNPQTLQNGLHNVIFWQYNPLRGPLCPCYV